MIASTTAGHILSSTDGLTFTDTGLRGNTVSISPNRAVLGYWNDNHAKLFSDNKETNFLGGAYHAEYSMYTWSLDSRTVVITYVGSVGGVIERLGIDQADVSAMTYLTCRAG